MSETIDRVTLALADKIKSDPAWMSDISILARVAVEAMRYADPDKAVYMATAERHGIRPLVLISAHDELLERFVASTAG